MRRLPVSQRMLEQLKFVRDVTKPSEPGVHPGRCSRGIHYENQRTHDALLRRGLIRVCEKGFTWMTPAGEAELAKH